MMKGAGGSELAESEENWKILCVPLENLPPH